MRKKIRLRLTVNTGRAAAAMGLMLAVTAVGLAAAAANSAAAATFGPPITNETPLGYRIDLTIDPAEPRFAGHVEIDIKLKQQSKLIRLYGNGLAVTRVEARAGGKVVPATYRQVDSAGHAEVVPASPLPAGGATLVFDYSAALQDGPSALFHAKVDGEWYVWSDLESTHPRRVFPSFDQINFKTPFSVSLTVPQGMTALSAMPEVARHREGDRERHVFAPTPPLPTYLINFAVGPFVSVTGVVPPNAQRKQPLPLRIFAARNQAEKLAYTLRESAAIINLLEEQFGLPFPYPKIDQIGSPLMKGGMENAGAVVYGDDQLFPGENGSLRQQRTFGVLVAHELAHQWFGDFVTPLWWDDIWLKESFATWTANKVTPRWRAGLSSASQFISPFSDMDRDAMAGAKAMHQPLDEANSKLGYYFAYGKGSQILSMVEAYIGPERFRAGAHDFLAAHAHGSATAADFFSALGNAAGSSAVTQAMRTFTDQPGVPLLDIRREGQAIVVDQSRYAPIGVTVKPALWTIPFCYRVGGDRQCTLLDKKTTKIDLKGSGTIMPNARGTAYYRFNLTDADWAHLIAEGARMPVGEGIALNDSIWSAFRSGRLAAALLIDALHQMATNPTPEVALDGANRWMELEEFGLIPQEALPAYRAMLAATYMPMLSKLGFDPAAGRYEQEDTSRRRLRSDLVNVLAVGARQTEVMASLDQATDRFLAGDTKALDPALIGTAFKVRVRTGGQAAAKALLAKAIASEDASIRPLAIMALGANDDPAVTTWLISQLGHSGLRLPDEMDLVQALLSYASTQNLAIDWLRTNYARIAAMKLGRAWGPNIVRRACSMDTAAKIERIIRPTIPGNDTSEGFALAGTLETIKTCSALRLATSGGIAKALQTPRRVEGN